MMPIINVLLPASSGRSFALHDSIWRFPIVHVSSMSAGGENGGKRDRAVKGRK